MSTSSRGKIDLVCSKTRHAPIYLIGMYLVMSPSHCQVSERRPESEHLYNYDFGLENCVVVVL